MSWNRPMPGQAAPQPPVGGLRPGETINPGPPIGGLLPGQSVVPGPPLGKGQWLAANNGGYPPNAVSGGFEHGNEIFVARAYLNGGLLPGKIVSGHQSCSVPWGGNEHFSSNYEVLCHPEGGSWVSHQPFPEDAVVGGNTENGEPLYVGRVLHDGSAAVGKIQKSHGVCYYTDQGQERSSTDYEVLVLN